MAACGLLLVALVIFIHSLAFYSQGQRNDIDNIKCVDIYKQPAFNHPKLKHHKLQFVPNLPQFPKSTKGSRRSRAGMKSQNAGCPKGKVPILANPSIQPLNDINSGVRHFATISTPTGEQAYHGGGAVMGVYNPVVEIMQSSKTNIWVQSGPKSDFNSIEVGWAVHPDLYGDNYTRLTTYWTVDNFQATGCYNLLCSGFVQIETCSDPEFCIFLGQAYPIDIDHPTFLDHIAIMQDNVTGNWWLVTEMDIMTPVGYWPKEIFTYLALGAEVVKFGGTTSTYLQQLDRPPMGSGRYPQSPTCARTGFFNLIRYVNESYNLVYADQVKMSKVLDSCCYGLVYYNSTNPRTGLNRAITFGGPGGTADQCNLLPPNCTT